MLKSTMSFPTLYEYYGTPGTGISVENPYFTLNGKNITIYSGAIHYFRVPPEYWRDRLRKLRAAGLNTVETYVPWNLHEPQIGQYDFGNGDNDMSEFLDLARFLKTAQEEDLLAIVRPGPFICAEWDFGGLPSWLLRDPSVKFRTSDNIFMKYVTAYFRVLLPILAALQFTKGGPIIAVQVENEYGSTAVKSGTHSFKPDKMYIQQLKQLMLDNEITELLFTSDDPVTFGDDGTLPDLFQTANFARDPEKSFDKLKLLQKNKPTMAMEFWTGWFDHWSEKHHQRDNAEYKDVLDRILKYPASVNLYMFHGGTNFGFLNGANINTVQNKEEYTPTTTSYDYDAPLSESGDYTEKYYITKDLILKYNQVLTKLPALPQPIPKTKYPPITIEYSIPYDKLIEQFPATYNEKLVPMEQLDINNGSGQSYGYITYRKVLTIAPNSTLQIKGNIHDAAMIIINGKLLYPHLDTSKDLGNFGFWRLKDGSVALPEGTNVTLDIVLTNMGRVNYGKLYQFYQSKGLFDGTVYLNGQQLKQWTVIPVEFGTKWINSVTVWDEFKQIPQPALYKAQLVIEDEPRDTFIDMSAWKMGVVFVNGFNLGRYLHIGPQQTLYLPAPMLKRGSNAVVIFEHFTANSEIKFADRPIFSTKP